jgi:transcriptional regulator
MNNTESELRKSIGKKIKIARLKAEYTQEQLAEKLSLSTRYISQLERGIAFGSASTIISVCKALDINANFLFSDIINVTDSPSVNDLVGQNFIENYLKLDDYNKLIVNALTNELVKIQKSTKAKKEA